MSAPLLHATAYALGVLYDAMDLPPDADLPGEDEGGAT